MSSSQVITTDDGFLKYIEQVNRFRILQPLEEQILLKEYLEGKSLAAAHKLVTSHLRLVVSIAMKFRNYGLPLMDLISEGNIGLMKAIKKFEPRKGTRLSTYAMWWIKAMIQEYILKSWSMLKISSNILQKKLFSNVARLKERIINDVSKNNYKHYVSNSNLQTVSLNNRLSDESPTELADMIADQEINQEDRVIATQERLLRRKSLKAALRSLNSREKEILLKRRLATKAQTLGELSKKFLVSSERIRQIEEAALKKLRKYICSTTINDISKKCK
jgi:RNA polymerase sigma-32 factor